LLNVYSKYNIGGGYANKRVFTIYF